MIEFVERKRWLFLGLPFTFTKYTIREDMLTIAAGFFMIASTLGNPHDHTVAHILSAAVCF